MKYTKYHHLTNQYPTTSQFEHSNTKYDHLHQHRMPNHHTAEDLLLKMECEKMIVDSILLHAEFGANDHREDTSPKYKKNQRLTENAQRV